MDRISTATKAVDLFGAGKHGFKNGDLANSILPTDLNAEWFNGAQEEVVNVIEGAGIAPDANTLNQLKAAIDTMLQRIGSAVALNTGTPDALVAAYVPAITQLVDGMTLRVKAVAANITGTPTFTPNTGVIAAKDIVKGANTALLAGDIAGAAFWMVLTYDAGLDKWVMQNPATGIGAANSPPPGAMFMWPSTTLPSWALARDGSAVSRAAYANLYNILTFTTNVTLTNGSKTLTGLASTTRLYVGMPIEGAGISAGTTIESITGATTATMTVAASAPGTISARFFPFGYGTAGSSTTFGVPDDRGLFERGADAGRGYEKTMLTGTGSVGSNIVTGLSTTKGLYVGMPLEGTGFAGGTTVATITSATAITTSGNSSTAGARPIRFIGGQVGNERGDTLQGHWHSTGYNSAKGYQGGVTVGDYASIAGISNTVNGGAQEPIDDGSGNGTPRTGPETRPRFRDYTPVIAF